jgi:hypothetical protein
LYRDAKFNRKSGGFGARIFLVSPREKIVEPDGYWFLAAIVPLQRPPASIWLKQGADDAVRGYKVGKRLAVEENIDTKTTH